MATDIPTWSPDKDKKPGGTSRKPAGKKAPRAKPTGFKLTFDELEQSLEKFIEGAAGFAMMRAAWRPDGVILLGASQELAHSYRVLAEANPYIRKSLDSLLSGSSTLAAIVPTISVAIAIASNHDKNPTGYQPVPFAVYEAKAAKKMLTAQEEQFADMTDEERAAYDNMMSMMAMADALGGMPPNGAGAN